MAGRPRTPTAVLEAKGSFKTHKNRRRDNEPVVKEPIGQAPARLNSTEVECWKEIVANAPPGVLTRADRNAVELCAKMMALSWTDFEGMSVAMIGKLMSALGSLGMNPSDRSRLTVPKVEDANPFAKLGK